MSGNGSIEETRLEAGIARAVESVLPEGWTTRLDTASGDRRPELAITSPAGESVTFGLVAGRSGNISAAELATPSISESAGIIYVSQYIPAPTRGKLKQVGVSYADTTGWVRIVSDKPMLVITGQGATKSPRPSSPAAVTRLNGRAAGRIIRTLLNTEPPPGERPIGLNTGLNAVTSPPVTRSTVGVRELAQRAVVSPGTVSKTLPTLVADDAVERDGRGYVTAINRRQLLDRWTADYLVLKSNGTPQYYVAPRGIDAALAKLKTMPKVALTGGQAGAVWLPQGTAPLLPVTQLVVYTTDTEATASELGLVPVDPPSANTILVTPQDPAILDGPATKNGIPVAPLPIVLADLLTLPGRYPQQAEALMDALAKTDPAWRP
jgi:hypothetical protein